MVKFSILVPTRDRPKLAFNFMDSLWRNTVNKEDIEVLFACDEDDSGSQMYVQSLQKRFGNQVKLFTRPRTEFINRDYYNWLAEKATGEFLWIMADDLEIVHPGWDTKIYPLAKNFLLDKPDKIVCISIKDNTPPPSHRMPKFPCFPMFSRETLAYFGYLLHPAPPNWGVDYIAYLIFQPCGRLLEVHDTNYINHISWHTKQVAEDSVSKRIGSIFNKLKMIPKYNTDRIIGEEVPIIKQQLLGHIEMCRNNHKMSIERHKETV